MAKQHQRPTLFPAADAQLPKIHVTPEQHEELRAYMLPMAQEVIREGPTWGRSNVGSAQARGWKLVSSTPESAFLTKSSGKNYQSLTKAGDKKQQPQRLHGTSMQTPPTAAQCFMGYSKAPTSLEAIMSSVYCETTEELRMHTENTYGSVCLDCCVLATLEGATLEDPFWYLGIKWIALKSPVKKLVSSREFAFLELSGTHVRESDGQRMLYRILQSVNLRGYGGKDAYFGLTRAHIEVAYVYWVDEAASTPERPVLNVCTKGRAHLKGNLPLWLVQLYLKKLWTLKRSRHPQEVLQSAIAGGGGASEYLQVRKRSTESERSPQSTTTAGGGGGGSSDRGFGDRNESALFDMATTWVPNEERSACYVCKKRFQLVRRPKHHCRSCGEVICSDCTSYAKLNVRAPISRKRSSRALLVATGRDNGHAVNRSAASAAAPDQPFSTASTMTTTSQHKARVKAPRNVMPGDSVGTYVTVGKVCHQCIDLKAIMHNNSAAYGHHYQQHHNQNQSPPARGVTVWKYEGFDAKQQQYAKLLTLHPERDDAATEPNNNNSGTYTYGTSSTNTTTTNNNAAGGHILSSSSDDEEKYGALEPGSWRAAGLIVDASKYRKGSVSSLTSSDVRAIIEENGDRHETESATFTEGGRSSIVTLEERECHGHDDEAEVDEDDGSCHEDLEFKPATVASANELLASSEANAIAVQAAAAMDHERSNSGSLSNFNPDMLFDLHGEFSDDDDAEGGSDADLEDFSSREDVKSSSRHTALESSASSYQPLAMMALLSPTASSPPSWSRSRMHTGNGVSIADVKLAIAGHAELLDAVQCKRPGNGN
ncbi:Rrna-processing protein fcf2 [Globisporangium polare]